jgi:peptidoglycan lytic transglycosylase
LKSRYIATLCALLCVLAAVPAGAQEPAATLFARPGELLGHTLRFRGAVSADQAGRTVQIQREELDGSWAPTATTVVGPDGSFLARWLTDEIGHFNVRAIVSGAQARVASLPVSTSVTIYRPALATWYGPGFYGRHTACRVTMSHALLGVAHRTLPCGTPVEVFYGGRSVTVPVIDRGPFANGARYDLTSAAAQAIGLTQTATIGVVPHRGETVTPPPPPAPSPLAATGGAPSTG